MGHKLRPSSIAPGVNTFVMSVRTGITQSASADPRFLSFGASSHQYRFGAALSDETTGALEKKYGVRLPGDYRAFVTQIGHGGAGPSYGVFPIGGGNSEDYTDYSALAHAFCYTAPYNPTGLISDDGDKTEYWRAFDFRGALFICHHGCAARSLLIMTGPCRGQVWADGVAEEHGIWPECQPDGTPHTFASWYLAWLDSALNK